MASFMRRYDAQTYALLRIVTGFIFLWHGSQKLLAYPPPPPEMQSAPAFIIYIAGPIELFGGLLVFIGLYTRSAAFLCSGLMAFAYWMAHGMNAFLPSVNGGELAALYCFIFLFISAHGPGIWSIDAKREQT